MFKLSSLFSSSTTLPLSSVESAQQDLSTSMASSVADGSVSTYASILGKSAAATTLRVPPVKADQTIPFKQTHTFESRKTESARVRDKYKDRVPVIVERLNHSSSHAMPLIDKKKYLVPLDLTLGQFIFTIKKRLKLRPEEALFIFVNRTLPPVSVLMSQLYSQQKDADGFLYLEYSPENTFGQ